MPDGSAVNDLSRCRIAVVDGCLVVRPEGTLGLATCRDLRDQLLACAVAQPRALVVDLVDLEVERAALLSVFASLWLRTRDWPAVPLMLVAGPDQVPQPAALRRYVAVHDALGEAIAAVGAPSSLRRRTERWLPPDSASPSLARGFLRDTCAQWGLAPAVTLDAVLVAAELVTNAVTHARSASRLRVELRDRGLTVAVSDADARPAVLRDTSASGRQSGGLGLLLVTQLASTWGCVLDRANQRKVVWAVLRAGAA